MFNAVIWSFATQYGQMIVGFVSSVVLARLLSPEEVGIYSVSFALIGFATLLRNFGTGEYLIQEKHLTRNKLQTAFTINIFVSWCLGICVYFLSQPVAVLYERPEIEVVFHVLALNFIFVPFGAITLALLRRDMNFKALASIHLVSIMITAIVSITAAYFGQSYLSMAWGAVAGSICTALLSQRFRKWALVARPTLSEFSSVWAYSSHSLWINLIRYTNSSLAELLSGKFLGMAAVGLLSRGRSLPRLMVRLVSGGLKPVAMPEFAIIRDNPELLSIQYFKIIDISLGALWPCLIFLSIMAEEIVLVLFGEKWIDAAPVIQLVSVGAIIWSVVSFADELIMATGKIKILSKLEPYFFFLSMLAAIIGSQFDIVTLVALVVVVRFLRVLVYLQVLAKNYSLGVKAHLLVIFRNLRTSLPLAVGLMVSTKFLQLQNPYFSIFLIGILYVCCWAILLIVNEHPVYQLLIKMIRSRTRPEIQ